MKELLVGSASFEVTEKNTAKLLERKAIHSCDDCGSEIVFHLSPDHTFKLDEVECLMSPGEDFLGWSD